MKYDYDVLVVGSGFGGSVTALRATEKGYKVGVLEAGRRFDTSTLPRTSWQLRRFLWAPAFGMRGIQRITPLKDVAVLSGAGVGGGKSDLASVTAARGESAHGAGSQDDEEKERTTHDPRRCSTRWVQCKVERLGLKPQAAKFPLASSLQARPGAGSRSRR